MRYIRPYFKGYSGVEGASAAPRQVAVAGRDPHGSIGARAITKRPRSGSEYSPLVTFLTTSGLGAVDIHLSEGDCRFVILVRRYAVILG